MMFLIRIIFRVYQSLSSTKQNKTNPDTFRLDCCSLFHYIGSYCSIVDNIKFTSVEHHSLSNKSAAYNVCFLTNKVMLLNCSMFKLSLTLIISMYLYNESSYFILAYCREAKLHLTQKLSTLLQS